MEVAYLQQALDDLEYRRKSGNNVVQARITKLIESIEQTPLEGIGKPEALKHNHAGKWSRRITDEHRLIYKVEGERIYIYSLKGYYE